MALDQFGEPFRTFASEVLTVGASAVALTRDIYTPDANIGHPAHQATIKLEGASIRYLASGTTPSATIGIPADAGEVIVVEGNFDIQKIRFIRTGGIDATLQVEYAR